MKEWTSPHASCREQERCKGPGCVIKTGKTQKKHKKTESGKNKGEKRQ